MPQFNPTECAGCMATSNHDAPHYEGEWPHDARGIQVTGGKHCEGCSPNNDSYAAERGSSEQPNPTATDDALERVVHTALGWRTYSGSAIAQDEFQAAVRTAAERYGRAVAIAELVKSGCRYECRPAPMEGLLDAHWCMTCEEPHKYSGKLCRDNPCETCSGLAELRAADSTGGT
jgi:hypothetical protein